MRTIVTFTLGCLFAGAVLPAAAADPLGRLFLTPEARRLLDAGLLHPGYDCVLKCSHFFNVLEARGAISVTERASYIGRVRALAVKAARLALARAEAEDAGEAVAAPVAAKGGA